MAKKKKAPMVKSKEAKPIPKKTQQEILESTLVHHTIGQKRVHETEKDTPKKIPKHISPTLPFPPKEQPVDNIALGEIFYHKSALILEARIAASIPHAPAKSFSNLFNYLFLSSPYPYYESICLRGPQADSEEGSENQGTYYSRPTIHLAIFTYILKRISCLPIIEAEGYRINDHGASATDAAFIYFLRVLLQHAGYDNGTQTAQGTDSLEGPQTAEGTEAKTKDQGSIVVSGTNLEKSEEHGTALVIEDPRAVKAYGIFTQHPMKFLVQMKVGQNLKTEERAVIWCRDVGEGGGWDVQWEYMNKALAAGVCPKENYEF